MYLTFFEIIIIYENNIKNSIDINKNNMKKND